VSQSLTEQTPAERLRRLADVCLLQDLLDPRSRFDIAEERERQLRALAELAEAERKGAA
jgi:hypothetical protein